MMAIFSNGRSWGCTGLSIVAAVILGIVTAFLQISAVAAVVPVYLWAAIGIAAALLLATLISTAISQRGASCPCLYTALSAQLGGILGTILFSFVLLLVDIAAASVLGALLAGVQVFFFALAVAATACVVKCQVNCKN